jgi:aspartyl-tRNA(Asn)/glutamyl-tRNA(Gln) amidotransferase subunit C
MPTQDEVKHIADLARIELSDEEIKKHQEQLERILDYVGKLAEVKTDGVATADGGTMELENVWRADEIKTQNSINLPTGKAGKTQERNLIDMAGEVEGRQVKVKSVF